MAALSSSEMTVLSINSPISGAVLGEDPTITAVAQSPAGINKVEFLAYYEGVDTDGDLKSYSGFCFPAQIAHGAVLDLAHHDVEPMLNGNVLVIAWDRMTQQQAVAQGRDPALLTGTDWLPDSILEIQPTGPTTGTIVWEWHLMDHVIQDFDSGLQNYGVVANHPELHDRISAYVNVDNGTGRLRGIWSQSNERVIPSGSKMRSWQNAPNDSPLTRSQISFSRT